MHIRKKDCTPRSAADERPSLLYSIYPTRILPTAATSTTSTPRLSRPAGVPRPILWLRQLTSNWLYIRSIQISETRITLLTVSSHTAGPDCPDCPDTPLGTIVLVHVSHVNVQRGPAAPVDPILRNPRGKELQRGRLSGDRNLHTRTGGNLKKKGPSSIFNYVLLSVLFPTSFLFLFSQRLVDFNWV